MLRNYDDESQDPVFSEIVSLDLGTVVSSVSGPKRPHDRVSIIDMKADFRKCLTNKVRASSSYYKILNTIQCSLVNLLTSIVQDI